MSALEQGFLKLNSRVDANMIFKAPVKPAFWRGMRNMLKTWMN